MHQTFHFVHRKKYERLLIEKDRKKLIWHQPLHQSLVSFLLFLQQTTLGDETIFLTDASVLFKSSFFDIFMMYLTCLFTYFSCLFADFSYLFANFSSLFTDFSYLFTYFSFLFTISWFLDKYICLCIRAALFTDLKLNGV